MKPEPYSYALGIPSLSEKDHQPYIDLIEMAVTWAHKHKNAPPHVADPEADFVIYISFLISETAWWISRFRAAQKKARSLYRDPITYWRTIDVGVTNRKVFEECKKLLPSLDPEKYLLETSDPPASKQIAPERITKPKRKFEILHRKTSPYQHETCEKFLERKYQRWPFARLYRLTKSNNCHDSGVKGYWVLAISQALHSRKALVSLRTTSRFFHTCKKHGICMKVIKEDPEEKLCAIWVFAKTMRQAQRLLRKWRYERPRLRKLLLGLRLKHTS